MLLCSYAGISDTDVEDFKNCKATAFTIRLFHIDMGISNSGW